MEERRGAARMRPRPQKVYESLATLRDEAKAEISKVVIGQDHAVDLLLVAAIARGHVLLEGPPGSAKTLLGRAIAHVLGAQFKRLQFTPDTAPDEITGHYEKKYGEIVFKQGIVFTNVLLADEINRTPPRTQAALLEAMQEHTVTVEGITHRLPDPFIVIATQNPWEHEGIYPLPESQLDRFLFKIVLEYCDADAEIEILGLAHSGITPDMLGEIRPLVGVVGLDKSRQELDETIVAEETTRYVVALVRRTRELPDVVLGASSRAAIHLMAAAKANARLSGRDTVLVEDVRAMAPFVLPHRILAEGTTPAEVVRQALRDVD